MKLSGIEERLRRHEEMRRLARMAIARDEQIRRNEILTSIERNAKKDDLIYLIKYLKSYQSSMNTNTTSLTTTSAEEIEVDDSVVEDSLQPLKATMDTVEMMHLAYYRYRQPCPLCSEKNNHMIMITYTTPGSLLRHFQQVHDTLSNPTIEFVNSIHSFIEINLHKPSKYMYRDSHTTCSFLVDNGENDHDEKNELLFIDNHEDSRAAANIDEGCAAQHCSCGMSFDNISSWCTHLSQHSKETVLETISNPKACMVSIREGYLCECTSCNADDVSSSFCLDCNHPKMLHSDCIRKPKL